VPSNFGSRHCLISAWGQCYAIHGKKRQFYNNFFGALLSQNLPFIATEIT
jgi:hypothetical protein